MDGLVALGDLRRSGLLPGHARRGLAHRRAILTAPFWALFAAWPVLWLMDRRRAKRLWAEETAVVLAPDSDKPGAALEGGIALPVIFGRERTSSGRGVAVPMLAWASAFPTVDPKAMGLAVSAADKNPGVHLEAIEADGLLAFEGWEQSAQDFDASADDWEAARKWTERLRMVLRG